MISKKNKELLAEIFADIVEKELYFEKSHSTRFDKKNFIYTFIFDSNEEIFVNLELLKSHRPKNECGCNITFGVYKKGIISDIMFHKLKLNCYIIPSHLLVKFHSINVTNEKTFNSESDLEIELKNLFNDIKDYILFLQAFIDDYNELLHLLMSNSYKGMIIENKFTFGLIVMGLTKSFRDLDKWIDVAQKDKWFGDFHRATDYQTEIVFPVKKFFDISVAP